MGKKAFSLVKKTKTNLFAYLSICTTIFSLSLSLSLSLKTTGYWWLLVDRFTLALVLLISPSLDSVV